MKNSKKQLFFLIMTILIGIILFSFAVIKTYDTAVKTKNYVLTEAEFIESIIYSSDEEGTTYRLTYSYVVDGQEYRISTNYGTGSVPSLGTKKNIKYNPDNPKEAVISGIGENGLMYLVGFMFITIPLFMLFLMNVNSNNWVISKIKDKVFGVLAGMEFIILGSTVYIFLCSGGNSLSIIEAFKINGLWIMIPIIFIVGGIYFIVASFLFKKSININIKNNEENSENQIIEEISVDNIHEIKKSNNISSSIFQIIGSLTFTVVCALILIKGANNFTKISIIPFLICGLVILLKSVLSFFPSTLNSNKFQVITSNIYKISFLTFWFGFLILIDYICLKNLNEISLQILLFSLIFWIVGIIKVYKQFKK